MSAIDIGSVLVALIAALSAWASQRSAQKANRINTSTSGRLEAERGAYERARAFDVQTIDRQDAEIAELRTKNKKLEQELERVKGRLHRLENLYPEWERLLHERIDETDDHK